MAKINSTIFNVAAGSIGGLTFARSRGGLTIRHRSKPTVNRSNASLNSRNSLKQLSSYWAQTLTPEQRDAWNRYAQLNAHRNKIGASMSLTGHQTFIKYNAGNLSNATGNGLALDAPPVGANFPPPQISAIGQIGAGVVSIEIINSFTSGYQYEMTGYITQPCSRGAQPRLQTIRAFATMQGGADGVGINLTGPDPWDPNSTARDSNSPAFIKIGGVGINVSAWIEPLLFLFPGY